VEFMSGLNILLLQGVDLEDANKQADRKKSRTRANKKTKVRVQYTTKMQP